MFTRERIAQNPDGYAEHIAELRKAIALGDHQAVEEFAHVYIDEEGFDLPAGSPMFGAFCQMLMRTQIEAATRWTEHDRGIFGGKPLDPLAEAPPTVSEHAEASRGKRLLDLFTSYERFKSKVKPDTMDQRKKTVKRFAQFVGESRAPESITRADVREWRELLFVWPKYADQCAEFRSMDFHQVLEANKTIGRPTITVRVIVKYLTEIRSFFSWLVEEGHMPDNPAKGLAPEYDRDEQQVYPYEIGDLQKLFSSPLFAGAASQHAVDLPGEHRIRDWRFWLPVMAIFTGARQGELAQLELADVQCERGIWFLDINNRGFDKRKSVKAKYSKRRIPIHQELVQLGFLEFYKNMKATGATQLFPDARRDTRGQFGPVSKYFQRYFKSIGVKLDSRHNFHSFRHNFTDALRRADFTEREYQPLIGHSGRSTTSRYGIEADLTLSKRKNMIDRVAYPGLDLKSALAI